MNLIAILISCLMVLLALGQILMRLALVRPAGARAAGVCCVGYYRKRTVGPVVVHHVSSGTVLRPDIQVLVLHWAGRRLMTTSGCLAAPSVRF